MSKRNPFARSLRSKLFSQKIVAPKKGYKRGDVDDIRSGVEEYDCERADDPSASDRVVD